MTYNVIIPCSGPGSRSSGYSKFHKALIRIGDRAVISHIIDSYPHANTIYVMLGHNGNYIREYLEHCEYTHIKYIEIENWHESQYASLKQLPIEVFDEPFYLNSCDNWTTTTPISTHNTAFFCKPKNIEYYDTVNGEAFAGIGYVSDPKLWHDALFESDATRNDYLIYEKLPNLKHVELSDWYDVGNVESLNVTLSHFNEKFNLLDKTHQEIYYVNDRVIKLFKANTENLVDSLTKNNAFPHPGPITFSEHGLSYPFVEGETDVKDKSFEKVFNNLFNLWTYCKQNNKKVLATDMWQIKTIERFDQMIKKYPEFSKPIYINDELIDPIRVLERINWSFINQGILGPCHGDLNLDNIILGNDLPEQIHYIDHRQGEVNDIHYDICKFYHSLHLNNTELQNRTFEQDGNRYIAKIVVNNFQRRQHFVSKMSDTIISQYKLDVGVGCIWLSMAPLNVSDDLNKFLFTFSIAWLHSTLGIYEK